MQDIDIATLKKRSIVGIVALTTRTFLLQVIAFVATFLLTVLLSPSVFGVYYVVSAVISFLGYFSDIGLAAALVQKKETPTRDEIVSTFTMQQILVLVLVLVSLVSAPYIGSFYHLEDAGTWLFRALVVSFFLSSLKTIPSILLERELQFDKLVIPTIAETLAFYVVTVYLAWKGYGITSFSWGVLARGLVGVIALYSIRPWQIAFGLSRSSLGKLLQFGVPFQMNSFLALIKDDLFTVFLGKILPFQEVGYIGWAKKWAEVPLRLIMDSIIRVTFPAFSRLQHDAVLLRKAIEKTIYGLSLTMLPISVALLFFIQPMVESIPRYAKWNPAMTSFYFFVITSAVAGLTTPLTNALNALGKIKTTLVFMIMWTVMTWVFSLVGIHFFGYNGVAIALAVMSLTIGVVLYEVKKIIRFSFLEQIRSAMLGSVLLAGFYGVILRLIPHTNIMLIGLAVSGAILYLVSVWILDSHRIREFIGSLRTAT